MNIAALAAARAYAAQASAVDGGAPLQSGSGIGAGSGFADLLESALATATETGEAADAGMRAQAIGRAEVVDVVTAVAEAELTVQTIVTVRDRVISAYQEIMRMPI